MVAVIGGLIVVILGVVGIRYAAAAIAVGITSILVGLGLKKD